MNDIILSLVITANTTSSYNYPENTCEVILLLIERILIIQDIKLQNESWNLYQFYHSMI